jgi:flagellar biosynthesis protein FliR
LNPNPDRILKKDLEKMIMENFEKTNRRKKSSVGLGIAMGLPLGGVLGLLPLAGNVGWITGVGIGLVVGIVIASIADDLGRTPVYTLSGVFSGALVGAIAGLLLEILLVSFGYPALGMWFGAAVGLVAGTVVDTRKKHQA